MISIIVAAAKNGAIGRDNQLLWHIAEDLKYFKKTTMGHPVIMGRKTFDSIGKPLPGRKNIIVSHSSINICDLPKFKKDGTPTNTSVEICHNLKQLLIKAQKSEEEYFVIGGGSIYKEAFKYADNLYITKIDKEAEDADTFFPNIDPTVWEKFSSSEPIYDQENSIEFCFEVYKRGPQTA